ncbi:ABC transporter permease subunit [Bradyrhizobium sp. 138]|uniref:ABC transporter permease subunit n=1 Tax=Bradyrhizobium sp. 138 TaxID=2782615 RepID=UPI001FFB58CD
MKQVEPLPITSARTMSATPQQLSAVILPAALPTIFVGIRLASASVMSVLVASEMVGAKGLFHHQQPVQLFDPADVPSRLQSPSLRSVPSCR